MLYLKLLMTNQHRKQMMETAIKRLFSNLKVQTSPSLVHSMNQNQIEVYVELHVRCFADLV